MYNGGEAADQMVSYAFKGGEVVLRLSGAAAKNLAVYLTALLKQGGPSKGKTTLKRMIADGKELTVQRIDADQIPYFNAMAKKYGANVEAEIGTLASREDGGASAAGPVYTDPDLAVQFCAETGIDALAPSFGTAHGIYKAKPVLDLQRVKVISEKTGLPLVMHGGSGVSDEDYRVAIHNGIRKINYYSYMAKAGVAAVQAMLAEGDVTYYHDLALTAQKAMEENVKKAMTVFAGL